MNIPLYGNTPNFMHLLPTLLRHSINWLYTSSRVPPPPFPPLLSQIVLAVFICLFLRLFSLLSILFLIPTCLTLLSPVLSILSSPLLLLLWVRRFGAYFYASATLYTSFLHLHSTTYLHGQDCTFSCPLPTILLTSESLPVVTRIVGSIQDTEFSFQSCHKDKI
jgi:hypothetical protein